MPLVRGDRGDRGGRTRHTALVRDAKHGETDEVEDDPNQSPRPRFQSLFTEQGTERDDQR
jgi:hypothetical protein